MNDEDEPLQEDDLVPISILAYDARSITLHVKGFFQRTAEGLSKWQFETFDKIYTGYKAMQKEYDDKVAQARAAAGITFEGHNPAMNRNIERSELKKLCITMMTGQHFSRFRAMTDPRDKPKVHPEVDVLEALKDGLVIQFFEQAFEWEQMTYLFYPYFWGRKENWVDLLRKPTDPDPLFAQFLTAGAARVLVPVPLPYERDVRYLLCCNSKGRDLRDRVWRGGDLPTLDDERYRSIADEIRDQTDDLEGAKPEGEPWEFTIPTTLVCLQKGPELPIFT